MKSVLLIVSFLLTATDAASTPAPDKANTGHELERIAQALLDAVGAGDTAVWDRYLADGCLYTAEDGRTMTKQELLSELQPLPPGYEGRLTVANAKVRGYGDTAVITYDAMESLNIYGQQLHTRFHTTDTYIREDGRWLMIASQVTVVPGDPAPVRIDAAVYDALVGRYALAPGVHCDVSRSGNRLFMQRDGEKQELFPLGQKRFFRKGRRGEVIFATDAGNAVNKLILRRDNNDVVWTRVTEYRYDGPKQK